MNPEDEERAMDAMFHHSEAVWKTDLYDAARDAVSEARYTDNPQAENDSQWRDTLLAKGCDP